MFVVVIFGLVWVEHSLESSDRAEIGHVLTVTWCSLAIGYGGVLDCPACGCSYYLIGLFYTLVLKGLEYFIQADSSDPWFINSGSRNRAGKGG